MESLIIPCNTRPPSTTPFRQESPSEFPPKPLKSKVSFKKTHQKPVSTKPDPKTTDAHLNYLCKNGMLSEAIAALDSVAQFGSKVRPVTFTRLIQSCIDTNSIHLGRKLHKYIDLLRMKDPFVDTKLVGMYAKCGSLGDARKMFDEMRKRNLYTWSAMIGACSREKRWIEVVDLFLLMMQDGIVPDDFLFPKILQACGNCGDVETGKLIHSIVIRCGIGKARVSNSILAVYAKCGKLSSARRFFENMEGKDKVSWNSVITGYCQKGEFGEARKIFDLMQKEGFEPGLITWNILITSYNQSGYSDLAMEMMMEMENFGITPDVFTWTSMISGYAQNNRRIQALDLFREMLLAGIEPNEITLMNAISACASLKSLTKGKELHCIAAKIGFAEDVLVGNSLIDMHSKCGELEDARRVFDMILERDVYTWNSMIAGYCQAGYCGKAHDLFVKMQESNISPNVITWNVMITGYIQNGDEDQAMDLFQRMETEGNIKRNTASWNSLIAGYLQNGQKDKAFGRFRHMQSCSVRPNSVTILSILPACASLITAKKAKEIHGCVLRRNLESERSVANCLIDTYAKCGNIAYSKTIFDRMSTRDIISWNTMIASYVLHGCSSIALDLFYKMKMVGLKPTRGTFISIISSYGLAKRVDDGKRVFSSMTDDYYILPSLEHYTAMIHLLGRSGRLEEAFEFIEDMSAEADLSIWAALLTACRIHGNIRLAVHAGEKLLELEPANVFNQRLVLQTYAMCGISDDSLKVRKLGKRNETRESFGLSWIEVENNVHTFVAGDKSKPNAEILFSWIKSVSEKIKKPDSHAGLGIEDEENEEIVGVHSEKLATAFALIGSSRASQTIRIVKSLRMCRDCHRTLKFISKTYGCEIFLSDSKCLHHFKTGHCCCKDYW